MRTDSASTRSYLNALTAWRGIFAVGIVLFHHMVPHTEAITRAGVCYFFMVSGFLMQRRHRYPGGEALTWRAYGGFMASRSARLFPLHWLALLLIVALQVTRKGATIDGSMALHVALLQAWSPVHAVHYGGNSVAWFLSALLFCYACFPMLSGVVCRWGLRRQVLLLIAVGLLWAVVMPLVADDVRDALYVCPAVRVADFLAGMTIAEIIHRQALPLPQRRSAVIAVQVLAVFLTVEMVVAAELTAMLDAWNYFVLWWIPIAVLIVASVANGGVDSPLSRFWGIAPLQWLGKVSLELYLLQNVVQLAVAHLLAPFLGHFGWLIYDKNVWFSVPLLLPSAWAMHRWVSVPLRRRLERVFV